MVTALLRALGFDEETDAPPGEGQDRAVGSGQDVGVGAASADVNQNTDLGLSRAEAAVACGPAAAVELARRYGDNIPVDAVIAAARQNGWRSPDGMSTGPQGFARTMRQLGYDVTVADLDASGQGPGWQQTRDALAGGQSVAIDTPGHYYQATDYDPARGYRLGDVVGAGNYYQPGAIGSIAGGRYGAPRNAIIATPGAGAQARGTGQPQLLSAQGGQQAPGQNGPPSIQRIAMQAGADAELADIMAASALTESSGNPTARRQTAREDSVGLWQANRRGGAGAGQSVEALQDPLTNARTVMTDFQTAYTQGQRQGLQGPDLAVYTHLHAERPSDQAWNGEPATRMRANYAQVDAHSKQAEELHLGGTFAPASPTGPGQANAQAPSGPLQQAWNAAQDNIQQLLSNLGGAAMAAGGAVAGLGATPAHAAPEPQGPPPPPDAARDAANRQAAADRETALAAQRQAEASQAPAAAGAALAQPALQWGGGRNAPPPTPTVPAPAPPPAAPTDYGPGGFAGAAQAAGGAPGGMIRPPGAPVTDIPGRPAPPSTAPAAGIAETAPPPPGLPPDTETQHWDNNILAWVPIKPPADYGPGGGRYRIPAGVTPALDERGNPAPNPPGTPVEYVPNQPGPYPQGYYDGANWHAPTAASQAQQGTPAQALAPGLSFVPSAPNSRSGTLFWEDPNTHTVTQAPYTLGDPQLPPGLGQPQPAVPPPMSEYQRTTTDQTRQQADVSNQQWWADYQQRVAQTDVTNSIAQQRLAQEAQQHADTLAVQRRGQSTPTQVGPDIWGPDPNNPDPNAPFVNLGPAGQTPSQEAATAASQAQTRRLTQESTLPTVVNHRVYAPVTDPETGVSAYQDTGPESMSASEQALLDERTREFGTLSAYQQSQAEQSKASLAQNESQFQQSLAEKQSESARPYSQMTKAEQAADARGQQELGLKKEQLGLSEAEAANKLEQLPRGGIMRVDPFTGQSSLINAPEPEDIRMVGSQIYIPGGRQVSMLGQQISGGPNPYAGVPTGGGGMFQYPGAQGGGMGGAQGSPYQNWGAQGGGGWGGGGMSSSPGWAPPQQQRPGWMGSGY